MKSQIVIIDFGSQYTQLIARTIRELRVFCEIISPLEEVQKPVQGVILSGSPFSVFDDNAPRIDIRKYLGEVPLLGICYGAQLIAHLLGGKVLKSTRREYGKATLILQNNDSPIFKGVENKSKVWMSHADTIEEVPKDFEVCGISENGNIAAFQNLNKRIYGLQFHPEVWHSTYGKEILKNFLFEVCKCEPIWTPQNFIDNAIRQIKEVVKDGLIVGALSGGVDSTVAAILAARATPNTHFLFIDHGLLRKNEASEITSFFNKINLNVKKIDAQDEFISFLENVFDPEMKRKIIGEKFIEIFARETKAFLKNLNFNNVFLLQGTIYPDVIESGSGGGPSAKIKSHHNVGGLPQKLPFKIIEPLKYLFKDEVREIGKELGLPVEILQRHPFPGPGLAIRIPGKITKEKIAILQEVDYIFINELKRYGLYERIWQAFAVLLPVKSVGVMGDEKSYEYCVVLRAVISRDGMTASPYPFDFNIIQEISTKIVNSVKGVNRVLYDVTSKPPATIEWE